MKERRRGLKEEEKPKTRSATNRKEQLLSLIPIYRKKKRGERREKGMAILRLTRGVREGKKKRGERG